ncbi:hypothetical protein [Halomicrococcus sp. SG-WS-1]|uniref:hypothetical protein n=1 Tax=Halomicrococcus sp. SG-WS-1 TaxID=3439057 RepID=UPI003F78C539
MFDVIELVEDGLQTMLDSEEQECPSDDCSNRRFCVSIRKDDEDGVVSDVSCRDCDLRVELELDDLEMTLDELRDFQ